MNKVALVTDSASELTQTDARRLGLTVLPNLIVVGGVTYRDGVTISVETAEFYMAQGSELQTLPISVSDFETAFRDLLAEHDEVLYLPLSSKLSRNFRHAQQAAQRLGAQERVTVYDSRLATVGLARQVLRAKQLLSSGQSVPAVLRQLDELRLKMVSDTVVSTVTPLVQTQRLSMGRLALMKFFRHVPVLDYTPDGGLKLSYTVREQDALDLLLNNIYARFGERPVAVTIGLAGQDDDRVDHMRDALLGSPVNAAYIHSRSIGPAVSAYTGLGTYSYVAEPYVEGLLT